MNSLFDLDILTESRNDGGRDSILDMEIDTIFESCDYNENLLDMVLEDVSIPVPGGDKERPNVGNRDHLISIPGGDKESPGTSEMEISEDEYNDALDNLKRSFKESYELLEMLENATIV